MNCFGARLLSIFFFSDVFLHFSSPASVRFSSVLLTPAPTPQPHDRAETEHHAQQFFNDIAPFFRDDQYHMFLAFLGGGGVMMFIIFLAFVLGVCLCNDDRHICFAFVAKGVGYEVHNFSSHVLDGVK